MKRVVLLVSALVVFLTACAGEPTPAPEVQTTALDFILPNALGGEVSLSDYKGQPVFLFFHMAVG